MEITSPIVPEIMIEDYARQFLAEGRRNWDEPHTRAVVYYAGQIAGIEGLKPIILNTAAWLHDVGNYGQFDPNDSLKFDQVMDRGITHMEVGSAMARSFLNSPRLSRYFTDFERNMVIHLVGTHDNLGSLSTIYELAFMEADSLGEIDTQRVTPVFHGEDLDRYIEYFENQRIPRFFTQTGKRLLAELFPKFLAAAKSE